MKFAIPEEYPTDENLRKLELFDFRIDVIIPAPTIKKFEERKREIKQSNSKVDRVGYWPLFQDSTYWLSAWQEPKKLERKLEEFKEISQSKKPFYLVWDAEPPRNKRPVFAIVLPKPRYFKRNVKSIKEFIQEANYYNIEIITAELPSIMGGEKILEEQALAFNYGQPKVKMVYTSFGKFVPFVGVPIMRKILKHEIKKFKDYPGEFAIGLGCTAKGAWGKEPIMSLDDFKEDLEICKEGKIKTVAVYRLGGLQYLRIRFSI